MRDHVAYAAARVGHVAPVTRDQVDVRVPDRLAGSFAAVDPDRIGIRREARIEQRAQRLQQRKARRILLRPELPDSRDVAPRQHQRIAVRDRMTIQDRDRVLILDQDFARRVAEDAGVGGGRVQDVLLREAVTLRCADAAL